jgi:integrase
MAMIKLRHIKSYTDRHGKQRHYLRRRGFKDVALPGLPGSTEFMVAYNAALAGKSGRRTPKDGAGSVRQTLIDFYRSADFRDNLKESSQAMYRAILDVFSQKHGHRLVKDMPRAKAHKIIGEVRDTSGPAMATLTKAVLHKFFNFCIDADLRIDNPFSRIKRYKGGHHRSWTDGEMTSYERRWPLGTRERLAYALLLYFDQRGGDTVRLRRQDIRNGAVHLAQQKTRKGKPVKELIIPIHPALDRAIKAGPHGLFLIGDERGRPISRPTLTRLIKRAAKEAGLPPDCVPHGLRKALQRRLAEHGASAKQMQAVSGHATLKETELYTEAADQVRLARSAIALLPDEE